MAEEEGQDGGGGSSSGGGGGKMKLIIIIVAVILLLIIGQPPKADLTSMGFPVSQLFLSSELKKGFEDHVIPLFPNLSIKAKLS